MEIPHLPHLGQHPPGRPPHLLPCSSSSPRAWAGFCWHSLRRGPRGQEQYPGEAPPEPDRVRYLQPQPGQRLCSALGHSSGAGPGKTCHLLEPVVCPSHILAPCRKAGPSQHPQRCTPTNTLAMSFLRSKGPDRPFSQAAFAGLRVCMTDPEFQFLQVLSPTTPLTQSPALSPGGMSPPMGYGCGSGGVMGPVSAPLSRGTD